MNVYIHTAFWFFSKGETIAYQWRNIAPGIQHVAFAVMSGIHHTLTLRPREITIIQLSHHHQVTNSYLLFVRGEKITDVNCWEN